MQQNGAIPPGQPSPDAPFAQFFQQMMQQQQIFMQQQQQQLMHQQQEFFRNVLSSIQVQVPSNPEIILDSLANNIKEFHYCPEENITFTAWYARYDDLFEKDAARLDDEAKVRLLMRKMGTAEHERYISFILPKAPKDFPFTATVKKLKSLFGAGESVISKRYRCLQIAKQPSEDFVTYACRLNKTCVEFELSKLTEEQFKCLMFVCGLKSEEDSEVRTRLLSKIEEHNDVTLEHLSEDCQRLMCLKRDTAMIESTPTSTVQYIGRKQQFSNRPAKPSVHSGSSAETIPATPCWYCGAMHFVKDCNYKSHECEECGIIGHREGYCSSVKQNRKATHRKRQQPERYETKAVNLSLNAANNRRRYVQSQLNGVEVQLQLDTGSDVSIVSKQTWERIGRPPTSPARKKVMTATGDPLPFLFKFECDICVNNIHQQGQFYVVKQPVHLLGNDLLDAFSLWTEPISEYCNKIVSQTQRTQQFYSRKKITSRHHIQNRFGKASSTVNNRKSDTGVNRQYSRGDYVYTKIFIKNQWHWTSGKILERVGHVMYNVLVNDRKLVRSHINQIRDCNTHMSKKHKQLPLSILLDDWNTSIPASVNSPTQSTQ
ncbi:uncharacterized protein K02A2.6-like [Sabethes cyaneus]|uniref:uncharacterized protein K02A2.6-like n=1 Tax=Sabethes cyaneus TaxID=53552 RepID=UPI00237E2B97|nr:uncharacterized protein K02A2.6-like [Sabethes cyaneus]